MYKHRSYDLAAAATSISSGELKSQVARLEGWLRRILVVDDRPIFFHDADAARFLPVAESVLKAIGECRADVNVEGADVGRLLRSSKVSQLRLSDFQSYLDVMEDHNFKLAGKNSKKAESTYSRNVRAIEGALGRKLTFGRMSIQPTEAGQKFWLAARRVVVILRRSRAFVPLNFDYERLQIDRIQRNIPRAVHSLNAFVEEGEKKRLRPKNKAKLELAKSLLKDIRSVGSKLEDEYGPPDHNAVVGVAVDPLAFSSGRLSVTVRPPE